MNFKISHFEHMDFDIDWILWGNNDTAITPTVSGMENENNDGDMRRSNNHKECTDNVTKDKNISCI